MKFFKLQVVAFLVSSLLFIWSPNAGATSHDLHWKRQAEPLVITVYDQTRNKLWGEALRKLTKEWNAGTHDIKFAFTPDSKNSSCENGLEPLSIVVCIHETSEENFLAQANIYYQEGHIIKATVWMDPRTSPNRDHLSCHELGHTLGLNHREDKGKTCMTSMDSREIPHPDQKDFQDVNIRHSHKH